MMKNFPLIVFMFLLIGASCKSKSERIAQWEEYFETNYPFKKYSQTAVDNFEFGGMENTTCTTLTRRVLHDKTASTDYRNDIFLVVPDIKIILSANFFDLQTLRKESI